MPRKTVEVSALPRMLQQLVSKQLARTDDLAVFDPASSISGMTPDAYLLSAERSGSELGGQQLRSRLLSQPASSVVVVSDSTDNFDTYELQICRRSYAKASMHELIAGIRSSLASALREVQEDNRYGSAVAPVGPVSDLQQSELVVNRNLQNERVDDHAQDHDPDYGHERTLTKDAVGPRNE